jgi:hypothetical protein
MIAAKKISDIFQKIKTLINILMTKKGNFKFKNFSKQVNI